MDFQRLEAIRLLARGQFFTGRPMRSWTISRKIMARAWPVTGSGCLARM